MARPNSRGLELTYHAPSRSWTKIIDGKRLKFGAGRGWSDRTGYRKALKRYRAHLAEHSDQRQHAKLLKQWQKRFAAEGREPAYAAWALAIEQAGEQAERKRQQQVLQEADLLRGRQENGQADGAVPLLGELLQQYLQEQHRRHQITRQQPESLPRKRRLGLAGYQSIRDGIEPLRRWLQEQDRDEPLNGIEEFEQLLADYRHHLEDRMLAGELSPRTVSNRVRGLRPLVKWLWQHRHLSDLPRNLEQVCQQFGNAQQAKALSPAQVHQLWRAASPRERALMALALNAGLYARELASLRVRHIRDGYLAKRREKTGVPYKIRLWDLTQRLIQQTADGKQPDDLLFVTPRGNPLCRDAANSRSDSIAQQFAKLRRKAKVKGVTWSMLRDTAATAIERIGKGQGNRTLVSQFLAHADGRTAKFYVDQTQDPMELASEALDAAVAAWGRQLALETVGKRRQPTAASAG